MFALYDRLGETITPLLRHGNLSPVLRAVTTVRDDSETTSLFVSSPMKRAANSPARNRPRKKSAASGPVASVDPEATTAPEAPAEPADGRNVNSLEGALSLGVGVLMLVAALFPRSIKQLLLLSLGGGLVYRGMTGHCGVYKAVGIDTAKEPLLPQLTAKLQ